MQHVGATPFHPLKVGKENMAGLLGGVERYVSDVKEQVDAHRRRINAVLMEGFRDLPETRAEIVEDEARIGLARVTIRVDQKRLGFGVRDIFQALANGNPPVRARPHLMSQGPLGFDCRIMTEDDAREVVRKVRAFYRSQEVVGRRAALPAQ